MLTPDPVKSLAPPSVPLAQDRSIFMKSLKPKTWETTESWKTTENDIYARVSIGSFILNNQHSIEPLKSNDFSS